MTEKSILSEKLEDNKAAAEWGDETGRINSEK